MCGERLLAFICHKAFSAETELERPNHALMNKRCQKNVVTVKCVCTLRGLWLGG